jgi:ankyrin repeat protein
MPAAELFAAIAAGDDAAVGVLLGADPTLAAARDEDGVSAVLRARYRMVPAVAARIEAALPSLDVFEAAALGRPERVETLLVGDASLTLAWSPDGFTALHLCAFFGGAATARSLLAAGADPNARSRNEFWVLPLHSAAAGGHSEVIEALLAAGADPNLPQRHGYTPLHGAAENGDAASVALLLEAGADPAAATDDGRTALDLAMAKGHDEVAARLRD